MYIKPQKNCFINLKMCYLHTFQRSQSDRIKNCIKCYENLIIFFPKMHHVEKLPGRVKSHFWRPERSTRHSREESLSLTLFPPLSPLQSCVFEFPSEFPIQWKYRFVLVSFLILRPSKKIGNYAGDALIKNVGKIFGKFRQLFKNSYKQYI